MPLNSPLLDTTRPGLIVASAALAAVLCGAAMIPAHSAKAQMMNSSSVMVARPANVQACTGCHGKDLSGKTGFSPSIRASGELKHYTKAQFEQVMKTGVTNDGGMVKKPMPIFHYTAAESAPLYAYLKSLK